jgi:hypothetical protein
MAETFDHPLESGVENRFAEAGDGADAAHD